MSSPALLNRSSGILLHLTSLPGPFGIGDLGPMAFRWVDTLARAGQGWWQVLPVGPTGFGDSPYQSPSTFAGNPNLINPEALITDGLAGVTDVAEGELPSGPIDYPAVIRTKRQLLSTAFERFRAGSSVALRVPFQRFCEQEADWMDDFALFAAIKDHFGGLPWWEWSKPLAHREPDALRTISEKLSDEIEAQRFGQFLFF
ncbi:MAG: 4-alpha-glucanotransferase, partial [Planctomycetia bacterium]|nr:4-alpha-glucanotransferase [Planctomycetia bacterium]